MKQDWEMEHLKDQIFLAEEQAEMEKEFYLWMKENNVNYDNTGQAATIIGEGIGHEPLFSDSLPAEWDNNKPATIKSEDSQLGSHTGEKRVSS